MGTIIKNELIRIVQEKKIYIFFAILGILTIGIAFGVESLLQFAERSIENGNTSEVIDLAMAGEPAMINAQNYPRMILGFVVDLILPLMSVVLLAELITADISSGRIRYTLVGPIGRCKVILGKSLAVMVIMFFLMGFMFILSYISGNIFVRSELYIVDDVVLEAGSIVLHTLGVYLKSYMVLVIFTITLTPICLIFKKMTSVIMFSMVFIIGSSLISVLCRGIAKYLITSYFKAFTYMVNKTISIEETIIFLAYVIISVILTVVVFNKKEVTE